MHTVPRIAKIPLLLTYLRARKYPIIIRKYYRKCHFSLFVRIPARKVLVAYLIGINICKNQFLVKSREVIIHA